MARGVALAGGATAHGYYSRHGRRHLDGIRISIVTVTASVRMLIA